MKRMVLFFVVGVFLFSYGLSASATEIKTYGFMRVFVSHVTNWNFNDKKDGDEFTASQRLRPFFDFIASENLKATLGLEFDTTWGKPRSGKHRDRAGEAGMDTASNTELKRAMLSFKWPGTDILIRAGAQGVALPGIFKVSPVLNGDVTGVVITSPVNDMFSLTTGWLRPYDSSAGIGGNGGEIDALFLSTPVKLQGINLTPYFIYGHVDSKTYQNVYYDAAKDQLKNLPWEVFLLSGQAIDDIKNNRLDMDDGNLWYAGLNYKLSLFEPLVVKGSLIWGKLDTDSNVPGENSDAYDREGWWMDLALEYKLSNMNVAVYGLYSSGDDDNPSDGSEMLPLLIDNGDYGNLAAVAVGKRTFTFSEKTRCFAQRTPAGVWLIGFALKNISVVDRLKSLFAIEYGEGVNDSDMIKKHKGSFAQINDWWHSKQPWKATYLTDEDSFVQVRLDSKYKIYDNLSAILELGYASLDMDEDTWGKDYLDDPVYVVNFGFVYKF